MKAKFPYQLILVPQMVVQCPCGEYSTCLSNFNKIAAGTTLFEVHTRATPKAEPVKAGSFVSTSAFTPSGFGDNSLFFKHQWMEQDFQVSPLLDTRFIRI